MATIVHPDIVEMRATKCLFSDGDLVAFLIDSIKFEMRSIPNFDEEIEFILKNASKNVTKKYRTMDNVTQEQIMLVFILSCARSSDCVTCTLLWIRITF